MPRLVEVLKQRAKFYAKMQNHDMGIFRTVNGTSSGVYKSECRKCGAQLVVRTAPMPNQIDIGDEAITLECGGKK